MSAVFTPRRTKIGVDRFQKMVETGVLTKDDRVELIEGEMIDMAPIGSGHSAAVARLNKVFVRAVGDSAIVWVQSPVTLGGFSEPQPDLLLLRPRADGYSRQLPTASDVLLLVEVSDTSLAYDRGTKLPLYAAHGVPEAWIVDLPGRRIEVHRAPGPNGYRERLDVGPDEAATPTALPEVKVEWAGVFG